MGFSGGVFVSVARYGHNFVTVDEFYAGNQFWQLISASQLEPIFLRSLDQFEDHDPRLVAGQAAFRLPGAMADCREGAFNGIRCADVAPGRALSGPAATPASFARSRDSHR